MLRRRRLTARHPRGIAGIRRRRFRKLCDEVGEGAQIIVAERLRHLVHDLVGAQLFAEHEELDQRIGRLLGAERGRALGLRLPALAVAREARRDALFEFLRAGGGGGHQGKRERDD